MPRSPIATLMLGIAAASSSVAWSAPPVPRTTTAFDSEKDNARASDPGLDTLAIANDRAQRMTVMVSVGGEGPFAFLVDTGSERTAISRQLAKQLGLGVGAPVRVHSTIGTQMVSTVNIPQLGVGSQALSVTDAPTFEAVHIGASGILGIDSLRAQRVVFDFKAGEMQVAPSRQSNVTLDHDTIVVRARSRQGRLILTKVTLDGIAIAAILDTGAQISVGNLALLRRLRRAGRVSAKRDMTGVDSQGAVIEAVTGEIRKVDLARVKRLDLGGVELTDVSVAFSDARIFKALGYDKRPAILLGIDALRSFDKVSIDFAQRKVRFVVPDATPTRVKTAAQAGEPHVASRILRDVGGKEW